MLSLQSCTIDGRTKFESIPPPNHIRADALCLGVDGSTSGEVFVLSIRAQVQRTTPRAHPLIFVRPATSTNGSASCLVTDVALFSKLRRLLEQRNIPRGLGDERKIKLSKSSTNMLIFHAYSSLKFTSESLAWSEKRPAWAHLGRRCIVYEIWRTGWLAFWVARLGRLVQRRSAGQQDSGFRVG